MMVLMFHIPSSFSNARDGVPCGSLRNLLISLVCIPSISLILAVVILLQDSSFVRSLGQGSIFYIEPPSQGGGNFVSQGEVCRLPTYTKRGEIACYSRKSGKMNIEINIR